MSGLDWFTNGFGDLVVDIGTGNFGDKVAVFNLNWNSFHFGVINAVLSSNITTSMFDGLDRMSNSSSSYRSNMSKTIRSTKELGISFGFSLTFAYSVVPNKWSNSRSITDGVDNLLTNLLILNLLSIYDLFGTDIP